MEIDLDLLAELSNSGISSKEIANILGVSRATVFRKRKELGIKTRKNPNITKVCVECLVAFETFTYYDRKFCSQSCSAKFNNRIYKRKYQLHCQQCNSIIYPSNGPETKFCSRVCYFQNRKDLRKIDAQNGIMSSKIAKRYLIEAYGSKCMSCGWCEVNSSTGKVPIQLDHIDGNSDNNDLSNLRLLCPNCHSLTPTFGALNYGNGREYRRLMDRKIAGKYRSSMYPEANNDI